MNCNYDQIWDTNTDSCISQKPNNTHIFLTVLCWVGWLINLLTYRRISAQNLYIRAIWTLNFIGLFTGGLIGAITKNGTMAKTTAFILFGIIFVFASSTISIWALLIYTSLQPNPVTTAQDSVVLVQVEKNPIVTN